MEYNKTSKSIHLLAIIIFHEILIYNVMYNSLKYLHADFNSNQASKARAIWGDILFEAGSIGSTEERVDTEAGNRIFPVFPDPRHLLHDSGCHSEGCSY